HLSFTRDNRNATVQAFFFHAQAGIPSPLVTAVQTCALPIITIHGTNDAAVVSGDTSGSVIEAGGVANATLGTPTATGTLTDTDEIGRAARREGGDASAATESGYRNENVDRRGHGHYQHADSK